MPSTPPTGICTKQLHGRREVLCAVLEFAREQAILAARDLSHPSLAPLATPRLGRLTKTIEDAWRLAAGEPASNRRRLRSHTGVARHPPTPPLPGGSLSYRAFES